MRVYKTHCDQRGCDCQVQADASPVDCPACNNPLLEGGVVDVTAAEPLLEGGVVDVTAAEPPPPPPTPPPAPPTDGA